MIGMLNDSGRRFFERYFGRCEGANACIPASILKVRHERIASTAMVNTYSWDFGVRPRLIYSAGTLASSGATARMLSREISAKGGLSSWRGSCRFVLDAGGA